MPLLDRLLPHRNLPSSHVQWSMQSCPVDAAPRPPPSATLSYTQQHLVSSSHDKTLNPNPGSSPTPSPNYNRYDGGTVFGYEEGHGTVKFEELTPSKLRSIQQCHPTPNPNTNPDTEWQKLRLLTLSPTLLTQTLMSHYTYSQNERLDSTLKSTAA